MRIVACSYDAEQEIDEVGVVELPSPAAAVDVVAVAAGSSRVERSCRHRTVLAAAAVEAVKQIVRWIGWKMTFGIGDEKA